MARLLGTTAFTVTLLTGFALQGVTVISQAANASVYLGLPFASLEFEKPLSGTEMVQGYLVLDWRDADYGKSGHPLYDDWSVFLNGGTIDGNVNEIWMRQAGQDIWTTTTVPSSMVSIHLNADDNDGKAEVQVDGVAVAQFDMWTAQCCQTALVIVTNLANTTHTITVKDLGLGVGGTDVHTMGAAALGEIQYKWNQPPVTGGGPTNVFNGWNQTSTEMYGLGNLQAADDWVCTTTNPVTKVRWWGSFANWQGTELPPPGPGTGFPQGFWIIFFTNVPARYDLPWSHPATNIAPPLARFYTNYTWRYVGQDYDPRTGTYESCFLFEQELIGDYNYIWWFYQTNWPTGTNIYWLSIIANQWWGTIPPPDHLFGWKTRPRSTNSLAPDAAVTYNIDGYTAGSGVPYNWQPIPWPDSTNGADLAFELITAKWEQPPDLSSEGIDVNATSNMFTIPYLLADDFQCTSPGPITNITIWGSWEYDNVPNDPANVVFTLSFHTNVPASVFPWSMPGSNKWTRTFLPGQFTCTVEQAGLNEWWMDPPANGFAGGDHICYRYDFTITSSPYFIQQGTVAKPAIYWLDVQAQPQGATTGMEFGWKTSLTHWMDAACWVPAGEPYNGNPWQPLTYPPGHPRAGMNIDLAFRVNNLPPKWSQLPVPYTPTNSYKGWNQYSIYGGTNIVADDWVCTNAAPVTDIHWWGSFIGWGVSNLPPVMPDGFVISIWNDVPRGVDALFSHPGLCLTNIYCPALVPTFVGWDYDPRNPGNLPDACFKYDLDLTPDQWFYQAPGTNIYWISIAAQYSAGPVVDYPWGWKTRPRDTNSLAPDDAVRIFSPTAPAPGQSYQMGTNIWFNSSSWDMAFALTTSQCPPPTLNCLNLNVECGTAWSPPFAWDNCCNGSLTPVLVGSVTNGACPWLITETWKATDCVGQTNICARVITVVDTTPPVITCASNKTVECGSTWSFDLPTASDICCGTNVTVIILSTVTNGNCPWVIRRTWQATDCCTNKATCSQTVTVVDTTPPTITCATNKTVTAGSAWSFDPPTASDTCCGTNVTVTILSTVTNGYCPWLIIRTWMATDCCTNTATCSQTVTVLCPAKWVQLPDLTPNGFDVRALRPKILADDFLCTKTGPVTNIHIWASWLNDQPDLNAMFQLGMWSDVPRTNANYPSHPGSLLWLAYFMPGQYTFTFDPGLIPQPFYDPNLGQVVGYDSQTWQYDFPVVQTNAAFWQTNGNIYWLSVSEQSQVSQVEFGWKTALTNWNDDAVYGHVDPQWNPIGDWQELLVPQTPRSLNLAFALTTMWVVARPVITNIVVTNQVTLLATNQVIGLAWTYENGVHYQVLSATGLAPVITWSPRGPEIIGPSHSYWETNAAGLRRFYRVMAVDP